MAGVLAVLAEFEREILRERVRAGLAHAREKGQRLGHPYHRRPVRGIGSRLNLKHGASMVPFRVFRNP